MSYTVIEAVHMYVCPRCDVVLFLAKRHAPVSCITPLGGGPILCGTEMEYRGKVSLSALRP